MLSRSGFGLVVVFGLLPSCEEDPEVVPLLSFPPRPRSHPASQVTPQPILPNPFPTPKPVVTPPQPKPVTVVTPPPQSKPRPKPSVPKATPKPKPQTISLDEFRRQNKIAQPPKVSPKPAVTPPKVSINPSNFKLPPIKLSQATPSSSSVSPTEMNRYLSR